MPGWWLKRISAGRRRRVSGLLFSAGSFDERFDVGPWKHGAAEGFGFAEEAAGDEAFDGSGGDAKEVACFFEGVDVFGGFGICGDHWELVG